MKTTIILSGLDCPNCAAAIQEKASKIGGVTFVDINLMTQRMSVDVAQGTTFTDVYKKIVKIVNKLEPEVVVFLEGENNGGGDGATNSNGESIIKNITFFAGVITFAAAATFKFNDSIFLYAFILIGWSIIWNAFKNIFRGQIFDENFLMSVASIGAVAVNEIPEAIAVMIFYQVGEYFQDRAVKKSRKSISALMDIRPDYANVKNTAGELEKISPEKVKIGDMIYVKSGEKIPLDGIVRDGVSTLDTAALTGESLPCDVKSGDEVLSGSVNISGLLTIEVTKAFGESTVSKILGLIENASASKAPAENFITKFARYYTPAVVAAAILLATLPPLLFGGNWSDWTYRALVFLVISCPCALVISVPLSFFGGIGAASRANILVKGGNYLDLLRKTEIVVFDKTGTLTSGKLELKEGCLDPQTLKIAASLERFSSHPVAKAVVWEHDGGFLSVKDFKETVGVGVSGIVDGNFVEIKRGEVFINGTFKGKLEISDPPKYDSKTSIEKLKKLGVKKVVMLTGDKTESAAKIATALELDEFYAELLPQDKVALVEKLLAEKSPKGALLFAGDGINDAPVLARADIGAAMGGIGSDAAIEAADMVIMTDEPSKISKAIQISRKTHRIVVQNIAIALGVKAVILALGALGLATMWAAVFGDVGVAFIAVLNALRCLRTC